MNEDELSENAVSDESKDAPTSVDISRIEEMNPTADADISGDLDGREPGFTYPGPGA